MNLTCTLRPYILALGSDVKCVPALGNGEHVKFMAEAGDLAVPANQDRLVQMLHSHLACAKQDAVIVCDAHPGYVSSRLARAAAARYGLRLVTVQHHRAHVAAVAAEYGITEPVVGLAFDGTGYGDDGTIWGGEFFTGSVTTGFTRRGSFAPLLLLGGDRAVREPWRLAVAALMERGSTDDAIRQWAARVGAPHVDLPLFRTALERRLNVVVTSALGRWFDCASALLGVCHRAASEAQAAIALEKLAIGVSSHPTAGFYALERRGALLVIDLPGLFAVCQQGKPDVRQCAAIFHRAVAEAIAELAALLAREAGVKKVLGSGGCFLNRVLSGILTQELAAHELELLLPQRLSPGDQALAVGQILIANAEMISSDKHQ